MPKGQPEELRNDEYKAGGGNAQSQFAFEQTNFSHVFTI